MPSGLPVRLMSGVDCTARTPALSCTSSAGVPLTDSLVLVMRTEDDKIAARVAARM